MEKRDESKVLVNTAELLRELKQKAEDAEWNGHPNAARLRREYEMVRDRYGEGEVKTPLF